MMNEVRILDTIIAEYDQKYEMMNGGINAQAFKVLESIGLNLFSVKRFRDAGYDCKRKRIWLLTRTGTDSLFPHLHNRDLEKNPYFLKRYDEPSDATYEILLFKFPKNVKLKHVGLPDLDKILKESMKRLETGKMNKLEMEMLKRINELVDP